MWSPKLKNVESKITFGQLILRKIIKTLVTRCQIKAKMHQNSALGSLQRSPDPLAGFNGPTSKEREGAVREGGEGSVWSPKNP